MTNNLSQISNQITVSTWFLLIISESVDWSCFPLSVKPGHDYDALSQPGSCLIWAEIQTGCKSGCMRHFYHWQSRSLCCLLWGSYCSKAVFLHPAKDEHRSSSSKHNSGKGCSPTSLPLLHFEFNQPIGMGHHMSQAPNLISHFPALRPCCWSGLDSSG